MYVLLDRLCVYHKKFAYALLSDLWLLLLGVEKIQNDLPLQNDRKINNRARGETWILHKVCD